MLIGAAHTALCFALLFTFAPGQTANDLKDVKKVYVGSLGRQQSAENLRKELISQLKKSNAVTIVASAKEADAVLTGTAELWVRGYYSLNPRSGILPRNGTPVFSGSMSVELDGKSNDTLWSYLATPHFGSTDIRKDLCRELVKQLTQALQDAGSQAPDTRRH